MTFRFESSLSCCCRNNFLFKALIRADCFRIAENGHVHKERQKSDKEIGFVMRFNRVRMKEIDFLIMRMHIFFWFRIMV